MKPFSEKEWQVAVTTGDQEGSGTKAQVYLTIFGEEGDTGPLELGQPGGEDFAQGAAGAELIVSVSRVNSNANLEVNLCVIRILQIVTVFVTVLFGFCFKVKFVPKKVGSFTKIRLFVDNYVAGEGWFCEKVNCAFHTHFCLSVYCETK